MMSVKVVMYDGIKYSAESQKCGDVIYNRVIAVNVLKLDDDTIHDMGFDITDEFKEYIIITRADGTWEIFRNSYCDVFKVD